MLHNTITEGHPIGTALGRGLGAGGEVHGGKGKRGGRTQRGVARASFAPPPPMRASLVLSPVAFFFF